MAFSTNDGMQALLFRLIVGGHSIPARTRGFTDVREKAAVETRIIYPHAPLGIGRRYFF